MFGSGIIGGVSVCKHKCSVYISATLRCICLCAGYWRGTSTDFYQWPPPARSPPEQPLKYWPSWVISWMTRTADALPVQTPEHSITNMYSFLLINRHRSPIPSHRSTLSPHLHLKLCHYMLLMDMSIDSHHLAAQPYESRILAAWIRSPGLLIGSVSDLSERALSCFQARQWTMLTIYLFDLWRSAYMFISLFYIHMYFPSIGYEFFIVYAVFGSDTLLTCSVINWKCCHMSFTVLIISRIWPSSKVTR